MSHDTLSKIHSYIEKFVFKRTYYGGNEKGLFRRSTDVKIMHGILQEHPNLTNINYKYYLKYFNENFAESFGRSQIDLCSAWENLPVIIKDPNVNKKSKRTAVAELFIHKRRAKKYYNIMKKVKKILRRIL